MLSVSKRVILFLMLIVNSSAVNAAFTLNSTRYIYHEGKKSVELQIKNNDKRLFGGQVWIEPEVKGRQASYAVFPSLFKLESGKTQNVKLVNIDDLPKDRESLSYIYVQELPPMSESATNSLSLAMNIKVKLLYRPKNLPMSRTRAERHISVKQTEKTITLTNNTPFYFALVDVEGVGKITEELSKELSVFEPNSMIVLPSVVQRGGSIKVVTINDFGGQETYELSIQI